MHGTGIKIRGSPI